MRKDPCFWQQGRHYLRISNPDVLGPGAIGFFLVTLAGLIFSIVMLRSSIFAKGTAYAGILANVFGLGAIP